MLRLALRTVPLFAVIVGFAMALAAYMNFSGVRGAYLDLIRSRMATMAEDVHNDVNAALALGIRLPEQVTLPAVLARQAASDPLMLSIDVLGVDGEVVFSSDQARVGAPDRPAEDPRAFRYTRNIANDFGAPVGTVIVRLDNAVITANVERLWRDVVTNAIPAGIAAVIAGSFACFLLLTRLHRRAAWMVRAEGGEALGRAAAEVERLEPEVRA